MAMTMTMALHQSSGTKIDIADNDPMTNMRVVTITGTPVGEWVSG